MADTNQENRRPRTGSAALEGFSDVFSRPTVRVQDIYTSPTAPAYATLTDLPDTNSPHAHDFIEILVVVSGRGTHLSMRGTNVVAPGTVIVVRPGAWHAFTEIHDVVLAIVGISLGTLRSDLSFLRTRPATRELLYAGPIGTAERGIWIAQISQETTRDVAERVRRFEVLLHERPDDTLLLLGELIAVLGSISSGMEVSETREPVHRAVAEVLDLIEAAPERYWTAADLGAAVNLDIAYLTRIFRHHMGVPPIAYLARLRAEKAAHLLAITDLSISLVGSRVGWPNPTYFARRFQALIGLSPSEYRRRLHRDG